MPDILLIQPPIRDFYLTAKRTIPYGLACIAGSLVKSGYSVEILDGLAASRSKKEALPLEMLPLKAFYPGPDVSPFCLFYDFRRFGLSEEEIGARAAGSGAFLIGISSLFSAYSAEALRTAEAVRRNCPDAVIVLGGHHPTEMPEEVLRHECVDFVIRGDGEVATPLLAAAVRGELPMESVPGVGFRLPGGRFSIKPPAVLQDLDDAGLPETELLDLNFYRRRGSPCAVITAGRGCPLHCSYCSIGCSAECGFRLKSVRRVMEEMEQAVLGCGARFIDFEDENISYDRRWFLDLLKRIEVRFRGLGLELRAMNGLFPPALDEEIVRAMKAAGFTALNLSLCTTSLEQLRRFRRPDVREAFEKALSCAERYGLSTVAYIIAGAPGQNPEDSVSDLLYLAGKKAIAGVSIFYPSPGSLDFEKCRAMNLLPSSPSLWRSTALPISDTTTREDSATLLRLGRILNFLKSLDPGERNEVLRMGGESPAGPRDVVGQDVFAAVRAEGPAGLRNVRGKIGGRSREGAQLVSGIDPARRGGRISISERREIGKWLLVLFLKEAAIYGMTSEGRIFRHRASERLCRRFRDGLVKAFSRGGEGEET